MSHSHVVCNTMNLLKLTEHGNVEQRAVIIIIYEYDWSNTEVLIAKLRLIAVNMNIFKNIILN